MILLVAPQVSKPHHKVSLDVCIYDQVYVHTKDSMIGNSWHAFIHDL